MGKYGTIRVSYKRCVSVCFLGGKGGGGGWGIPLRHGDKENYKDLNLKNLTSEWNSNPRPHEYQSDALTI